MSKDTIKTHRRCFCCRFAAHLNPEAVLWHSMAIKSLPVLTCVLFHWEVVVVSLNGRLRCRFYVAPHEESPPLLIPHTGTHLQLEFLPNSAVYKVGRLDHSLSESHRHLHRVDVGLPLSRRYQDQLGTVSANTPTWQTNSCQSADEAFSPANLISTQGSEEK